MNSSAVTVIFEDDWSHSSPSRLSAPPQTSFHDDEVRWIFFEDSGQVVPVRRGIDKLIIASYCVKIAAHGIEFAEIKSENFHSLVFLGFGVGIL